MIYHNLLSHRTFIQIQTQQNNTISNSKDPLELTLSKIQQLIHQQFQNKMSNLSPTLLFTMYLTFLWMLYIP